MLAIERQIAVQDVPYAELSRRLLADGQVLRWKGPPPPARVSLDPARLPGLVFDDDAAQQVGAWSTSTSISGFVGAHYWHDGDQAKGEMSFRFNVRVKAAGPYEVRLAYTANPNRATNVPVTIRHADGQTAVRVNQKQPPPINKAFVSLGKFRFDPRQPAWIELSNEGTDGHVIADAVQLLPQ